MSEKKKKLDRDINCSENDINIEESEDTLEEEEDFILILEDEEED